MSKLLSLEHRSSVTKLKLVSKLVKLLPVSIMILGVSICSVGVVYSDPHLDLTTKTNINKVDPLFKRSIGDYNDFERTISNKVSEGIGNASNKGAYRELAGGRDADAKATELKGIRASELTAKGREEYAKDITLNGIFVDYSKPGMMQHREDAKRIADATADLHNNLFAHLKDLGVDCRTVKGNKIANPEYFIKVKKVTDREKGDTVYDKYMCEQLRNTYSCNDTLTMSCKTKGMEWGEWQDKVITVPGDELVNYKNDLLEGDHVADKTFEFKLFISGKTGLFRKIPPNTALVDRARVYLSTKHVNATIDNIDTTMRAEWFGGIHSINGRQYGGRTLGSKDYVWANYNIYYRYRDGKPACLEWQESWDERCNLK